MLHVSGSNGRGGFGFLRAPAIFYLQMDGSGKKAKRKAPLGIRQGCKVVAKRLRSEAASSKPPSELAVWMVLHKGSLHLKERLIYSNVLCDVSSYLSERVS